MSPRSDAMENNASHSQASELSSASSPDSPPQSPPSPVESSPPVVASPSSTTLGSSSSLESLPPRESRTPLESPPPGSSQGSRDTSPACRRNCAFLSCVSVSKRAVCLFLLLATVVACAVLIGLRVTASAVADAVMAGLEFARAFVIAAGLVLCAAGGIELSDEYKQVVEHLDLEAAGRAYLILVHVSLVCAAPVAILWCQGISLSHLRALLCCQLLSAKERLGKLKAVLQEFQAAFLTRVAASALYLANTVMWLTSAGKQAVCDAIRWLATIHKPHDSGKAGETASELRQQLEDLRSEFKAAWLKHESVSESSLRELQELRSEIREWITQEKQSRESQQKQRANEIRVSDEKLEEKFEEVQQGLQQVQYAMVREVRKQCKELDFLARRTMQLVQH